MTAGDIKTGKDMLKEDFILKNPQWHEELQHMIKRKEKAEIREYIFVKRAIYSSFYSFFFSSVQSPSLLTVSNT